MREYSQRNFDGILDQYGSMRFDKKKGEMILKSARYQTLAYNLARETAIIFKYSPILPYDTGNFMRNGIVPRPKNKFQSSVHFGNKKVPYAYYLEFNEFNTYRKKSEGENSFVFHQNRHYQFVEKIISSEVIPKLTRNLEHLNG